jgi:GR25 family glycosyltransferase involved in LPS biosynthesis
MNPQKLYNFILWVLVMGFVGIVFYRMFTSYSPAHIDDIWIINLDRDKERWDSVNAKTARLGGIVHRFPAMDGKTITEREGIHKMGVGYYLTTMQNKRDEIINKGVVGCWLSHKRLLQKLEQQDHQNDYGHLILEDDVAIPDDFLSGHDTWSHLAKNIPGDWDIVYLGMGGNPQGTPIADNIIKLTPNRREQYGTYAYLVKHGSIKTKLLPALRFMTDAIDEQYNTLFDDINAYCIRPGIINPDEVTGKKSSILTIH